MMMEKSLFALSNVVASGHTCSVSSASELHSQKWLPYWAVCIQTTANPFTVLSSGLQFCTGKPRQIHG